MSIAQRIVSARNDARSTGKLPIRCRISPLDMRELDVWIRHQNQPLATGLPAQQLDKRNLFGLEIVEDAKVRDILVLEMKPAEQG